MASQRSGALALVTNAVGDTPEPAIRFADVCLTFAGQDKDVIALDRVTFDVAAGKNHDGGRPVRLWQDDIAATRVGARAGVRRRCVLQWSAGHRPEHRASDMSPRTAICSLG